MAEPICENPEDLQTIEALLLPGEAVEAVFDVSKPEHRRTRKTIRLLGITSRRLIYFGTGYREWGGHRSVPYGFIFGEWSYDDPELHRLLQGTGRSRAESFKSLSIHFDDPEKARQAHDRILEHLPNTTPLGQPCGC